VEDLMEKPRNGVFLSPEAIVAIRHLVLGLDGDRSPTTRALLQAFEESGVTPEDRNVLLVVLGLSDESNAPLRRHLTVPPLHRTEAP
jgi:hypothetical protein